MAAGPKRQKVSPRDARGFARHPKIIFTLIYLKPLIKRTQNIFSFSFGENWGKVFVWMLTSIYCRYSRKQNLVGDYWII